MKLKKAYIYLFSFVVLCMLFTSCYYLSYLHALKNFNEKAIENNQELYKLLAKVQPTIAPDNNEAVSVIQDEITVLPNTQYTLQIYDMKSDTTETKILNPPAYLVGLTREEVLEYLTSYMSDLPLSEYNKGLLSYELVYFSDKELIIKKTYNEDFLPFRYYVVVKDGYVVVYNSDLKSIHTYTDIKAIDLPEEDRISLSQGIYVNSLEELYALLENFTS